MGERDIDPCSLFMSLRALRLRDSPAYKLHKLVYYEVTNDVNAAIRREKQIKGGSRQKKIDLVNGMNPDWRNLIENL